MKILVPTDFSDNARHAIAQAKELAIGTKGSITLLFSFYVIYDFAAQVAEMEEQIKKDATKNIEKELKKLQEAGVNADYKIVRNTVPNGILSTAQDLNYDLIIMGTQGASGIKKALVGSNTASVIKSTQIPVLAIPPHSDLVNLYRIVLAVENPEDTQSIMDRITPLIGHMKLPFEIVHVASESSKQTSTSHTDITFQLEKSFPENEFKFIQIYHEQVLDGIDQYIEDHPGILLVMYSKHKSFFESMFSRSHSVQMAYHTHVPLLVIKD